MVARTHNHRRNGLSSKFLSLRTPLPADRPPKMINLSQRTLNVAESSILKRGMKFSTADVDTTSFVGNLISILSHPTILTDIHSDIRNLVAVEVPADKGGAVVILDRDAYIQKATWTRPSSIATQSHLSNHILGL